MPSFAEQMAADLTAQELRGMERYATDAPSEEWAPEFHRKLAMWRADLAAYELAESQPPRAPRRGEGVVSDRTYWLSCTRMTVYATCERESGTILHTAPITRRFVGQCIDRLAGWMSSFGGFEMAEIDGPPAAASGDGGKS